MMLFASGELLPLGQIHLDSIGFWLGIILLFCLPILEMLFARRLGTKNIAHSIFGLVYISMPLALLMHLRSGAIWIPQENINGPLGPLTTSLGLIAGYTIPLLIIASIWINDTMAYIVGSLIGRTPLSSISPKKTWEGTIGGILLSVLTLALVGVYGLQGDVLPFALIAGISAVMGTVGDLFESKLKRMAGVKDSGDFMPGHGGFLDRFDSLLVAVPFVWLYCMVMAW
jgi:phosphatidate cytidylyltransferase